MAPLYTIGHSTRTLDELVAACRAHGAAAIADVRRFPGSRRNPQFGRAALEESLPAAGIAYRWLPALGGRRRRWADAPPSTWRVPAFAAYADYMQSDEFRAAIGALLAAAREQPTAVMCAEASPYRCHRRLISDFAELHGVEVQHILDQRRRERHQVTPFARLEGDLVVYDADEHGQLALPLSLG
jgi:uncharacterized protein (DUF488 family)